MCGAGRYRILDRRTAAHPARCAEDGEGSITAMIARRVGRVVPLPQFQARMLECE